MLSRARLLTPDLLLPRPAGQVHDDVHRLHDGLDRATLGIEAANRSIYLLCGAVVEVAKKVGLQGQHTAALDNMVTEVRGGVLQGQAQAQALPDAPQRPMLQVGNGLVAAGTRQQITL